VSGYVAGGFAYRPPYTLTPGQPTPGLTYPPASPHRYPPPGGSVRPEGQPLSNQILGWARTWWYRNINLLCIDYALRPRLSSRLTLGGRAFPQEPLGIRRRGSSPLFRYSCRHSHSTTLHVRSRGRFTAEIDAPLPIPQEAE